MQGLTVVYSQVAPRGVWRDNGLSISFFFVFSFFPFLFCYAGQTMTNPSIIPSRVTRKALLDSYLVSLTTLQLLDLVKRSQAILDARELFLIQRTNSLDS